MRQFGRTMDGRCEFSFGIRNTLGSWKNKSLAFRQVLLDHELPGFVFYYPIALRRVQITLKNEYKYHAVFVLQGTG